MRMLRIFAVCTAAGLLGIGLAGAEIDLSSYPELDCHAFMREALQNDPEFNQALQTYLKAAYGRLSTQAMGAWTLGASAGVVHTKSLGNNSFEPEAVDAKTYEISIRKLFLETGTRVTLAHTNALTDLSYPELNASGFAGFDSSLFLDTSPRTSTPEATLTLVQPLLRNAFGLADRFPLQAAELQAQAAELDVQEAWENRLFALFSHYLNWAAAHESVQAYQQITLDLQRVEDLVGRKVQAGVAERSDLLRIRENVLRTKSQLVQAEGNFRNESARIAYLRAGRALPVDQVPGRRPKLELPLGECPYAAPSPQDPALQDLRLLAKLRLLRKQLELQADTAGNQHLPSLDLVGSAASKGWTPDHRGGYDRLDKQDYSVLLNLEYPLGAEQARGEAGKARAGLEELDRSLAASERDLALSLQQLSQSIRDQEAILLLNREQEASAGEKLRLDERNYRIGRLDTFYLIDSTNNLNTARLQRVQTEIQLVRLRLTYLALSDRLLSRFPELSERLAARKGN